MSSKVIRALIIIFGWINLIGVAIYGANIGSGLARYSDERAGYGFLGFLIGGVVGFVILLAYYAVGNTLRDLERNAEASELILTELRRFRSESKEMILSTQAHHDEKNKEPKKNSSNDDSASKKPKFSDAPQFSPTEKWICKKCGQPNEQHLSSCKGCGAYK